MPDFNKRKRVLEERSHLAIEFPQTDNRVFRTYVPFLENPKISEKGSSNLGEYNLLGRPGSIFSYGGSPSRDISLTFKISLLHLIHLQATEGISEKFERSFNLFFNDKERSKKRFGLKKEIAGFKEELQNIMTGDGGYMARETSENRYAAYIATEQDLADAETQETVGAGTEDVEDDIGREHASIHRSYYRDLIEAVTGSQPTFDGIADFLTEGLDFITPDIGFGALEAGASIGSPQQNEDRLNTTLDMIYVWVNLIRATTLNNSTNTTLGPPTVRLTHGAMYNNVPCVVEDYSIKIIDESGFEIQSLTPKQLEITLSLRENRTGSNGGFETGAIGNGDTIVGWEAIIDSNNIDPYNGLINNSKGYL
tara:strand:- start:9410 stop:10510 length:1101 start_codon:yes stop_codon:yes gene_type:complete